MTGTVASRVGNCRNTTRVRSATRQSNVSPALLTISLFASFIFIMVYMLFLSLDSTQTNAFSLGQTLR